MASLMNRIMLSCMQATEYTEKRLDGRLGMMERMQLWAHTRMCDACKLYGQQSGFIGRVLQKHFDSEFRRIGDSGFRLPDEVVRRIIQKLGNTQ